MQNMSRNGFLHKNFFNPWSMAHGLWFFCKALINFFFLKEKEFANICSIFYASVLYHLSMNVEKSKYELPYQIKQKKPNSHSSFYFMFALCFLLLFSQTHLFNIIFGQ